MADVDNANTHRDSDSCVPAQNSNGVVDTHGSEHTLKEKVEMLKSLEKVPFDCSLIPHYLDYTPDPGMAKPILKKIVKKLVEVDAYICAFYDVLPEEEWENACTDYDTPNDTPGQNADLKSKLSILNLNFVRVYEGLKELKIESALDVLGPIFKVRTRNAQFLLFLLARDFPNQIFGFLLSKLKRDPKTFGPFFSSLLVRLDFDAELKQKCVQAFYRHFNTLKPTKTTNYLVLAQNLLYILCFREFSLADTPVPVKRLFEGELVPLMNKNIIAKFCDIHGQKAPAMCSLKNECLYLFPFDPPISKPIIDLVEEWFVVFR